MTQRINIFTLIILVLVLTACAKDEADSTPDANPNPINNSGDPISGDSGGTTSDTTSPTVTVTPTNTSDDVDTNAKVIATFNEDMLAQTIINDNFNLSVGSTNIGATVNFDAMTNVATLTPNEALGLSKKYTTRLSTDVTDLSGNPLADTKIEFTTRRGVWNNDTTTIDGDSGEDSSNSKIARNSKGDTIVVFEKPVSGIKRIFATNFSDEQSWKNLTVISDIRFNSVNPQVIVDETGKGMAIWIEENSSGDRLLASRYTAAGGWNDAVTLDSKVGVAVPVNPDLAVDDEGNFSIVWELASTTGSSIKSITYSVGSGWGTKTTISSASIMGYPKIAVSHSKRKIIVWRDETVDSKNVIKYYRQHQVDGTSDLITSPIFELIAPTDDDILSHKVVLDSKGWGTVAWSHFSPSTGLRKMTAKNIIFVSSTYNNQPHLLASSDRDILGWDLAVDDAGEVLVVWTTKFSDNVSVSKFSPFKVWSGPETINPPSSKGASNPEIAPGTQYEFIVIWRANDSQGTPLVWVNQYSRNGWGTGRSITSEGSFTPKIAGDKKGRAVVIWRMLNNNRNRIAARSFD